MPKYLHVQVLCMHQSTSEGSIMCYFFPAGFESGPAKNVASFQTPLLLKEALQEQTSREGQVCRLPLQAVRPKPLRTRGSGTLPEPRERHRLG